MSKAPETFNWIGSKSKMQYWDDPSNWSQGKYPDQKDAIAIFDKSLLSDTTIYLRKDIHLGKIWVSEEHTLIFDAEKNNNNAPNFYLETSNQFAPIFIDIENKGDVVFQRHIFHSCYFGQTHRDLSLNKPLPSGVRVTTIHLNGEVGNYKDPERASMQVYGHLIFQLNRKNTFKGPVVVKNNGQIKAMLDGAIPDGSPITIDSGGSIFAENGVLIKSDSLVVNGEKLKAGLYFGAESDPGQALALLANSTLSKDSLQPIQIEGLKGTGAIAVRP